jgi:hypothetical protein
LGKRVALRQAHFRLFARQARAQEPGRECVTNAGSINGIDASCGYLFSGASPHIGCTHRAKLDGRFGIRRPEGLEINKRSRCPDQRPRFIQIGKNEVDSLRPTNERRR